MESLWDGSGSGCTEWSERLGGIPANTARAGDYGHRYARNGWAGALQAGEGARTTNKGASAQLSPRFFFAQQGISLGVSGYLLKTEFQDEEWGTLLEKLRTELAGECARPENIRERPDEWKREFGAWLTGLSLDFEQSLSSLLQTHWSWMNDSMRVWLLEGMGSANREEQERAWVACELEGEWEWLACGDIRFLLTPASTGRQVESLLVEWKLAGKVTSWETASPFAGLEPWIQTVRMLYQRTERARKYGVIQDPWQEPIKQAVHYALDRLDTPLTVSEVASQVGLSRSHFSVMFKKGVGESFGEFLDKRRVKMARGCWMKQLCPFRR